MLMTTKQCAEYLSVSTKTIYRWVKAGYIPFARLGPTLIKFDSDVIDEWVREKSQA